MTNIVSLIGLGVQMLLLFSIHRSKENTNKMQKGLDVSVLLVLQTYSRMGVYNYTVRQ